MSRGLLSLVGAWLLAASAAAAQQGTTEVRGRVVDAQGAAMPGVTVVVRNQDTGMFRETQSADAGAFIASGLVPGRYEISATLQGFKTFSRRDLQLEVGRTTTIDVTMEVGAMQEVVTVSADSPLVDVTSKEIGGNITSETLVQLPSVNGNFIGFVGLLPGIVPSISTESFGSDSISVNGQDSRNNNYMVDGGNNNDDVIGQRAGMQARTPIEAVQEFQVLTGQYDAEFGRTTGAVVNAVIKSGTNVIRGSAFGFFQDSSLTAKDTLAIQRSLAKADTSYQRWGATIGGPILKDRLHYFASLERFAIDRANTLVFPTRPDLNDQQTTRDRVWNTIVRADHQLSPRQTYNVRWLREQSPQANQIVPTAAGVFPTGRAAREETDVDQSLAVSLNSVLSNTKVNTVRVAWTRENVTFGNACYTANNRDLTPCEPTLAYRNFTQQQDNTGQYRINDGIAVDDTLAWFLPGRHGDHDIKAGVQYVYSGALNVNHGNLNGTFTFGQNDVDFNPAVPSTYPDRFSIRVGGPSKFQKRYAIAPDRMFASLDALLTTAKPEAVAAFSSTKDHRPIVEAAAPRGVHVMVEKPLAVSNADAKAIEQAAAKGRIHVVTNYETTWYPSHRAVWQLLKEQKAGGALRKIVVMDGHEGPKEINVQPEFLAWLRDPVQNGGGALFDFGCYGANLMTWLMDGQRPIAVTAVTQRFKPAIYPNVDDEATILIEYPGTQGIAQASWNWPFGRKDLEVYAEKAYAIATGGGSVRVRLPGARETTAEPVPWPADEKDAISYLSAVVRGRLTPSGLSSLANNIVVVEILDAARESARTGKRVVLATR